MKKSNFVIAMLLSMPLILASCGGSSTSAPNPSSSGSSSTSSDSSSSDSSSTSSDSSSSGSSSTSSDSSSSDSSGSTLDGVYFECTFVNYDDSLLYSYNVEQGKDASYPNTDPTRPTDTSYSYIFSGWDKPLTNIQFDTTFKAQYTPYNLDALKYIYDSSTTSYYVSDCVDNAINVIIPSKHNNVTNGLHSVTFIGYGAFSGCSSLTSITIPSSVTFIDGYAFKDCSSLTSITIPNSVTFIDTYAFDGCSSLTIYCEAEYRPSGWDSRWNDNGGTAYWYSETSNTDGVHWHYVDGKPAIWA